MEERDIIQLNSSLFRIPAQLDTAISREPLWEATTLSAVIVMRNSTVLNKVGSNLYEWRYILPLYILIFLVSISGNSLVIVTLAHNRRKRTITNVYLMNLAASDLMLGVFCMPFTLIGQIFRQFLFGPALCKLIPFLQAVSVSVNVWTLVAISLERYCAICRPLKSRKWQTLRHAYRMIALVWMFSLMLNMPILFVSTLQPMSETAYKCREVWPSIELERSFNLVLDVNLLLFPLALMTCAYSLIVKKLWRGMQHEIKHNYNWQKQSRNTSENEDPTASGVTSNNTRLRCKKCSSKKYVQDSEQDDTSIQANCSHTADVEFRYVVRSTNIEKSIESKKKVILMLFVIIVVFFICWTPLYVINTIYLFYPAELYKFIGPKGVMALQLLAYSASCTNPITYCFMNKKFRQGFTDLFTSCKSFVPCCHDKTESPPAVPPPTTSSHDAVCVIRDHTGRTETEGQVGEDCV